MKKKNKIPPRIAANVRKYLGIDEQEKKYPHPDGYSNLVKCMSDYRHIKKNQRRFFNSFNGSRNYANCTMYRGKPYDHIGPSVLFTCGQKDPVPLNVYNNRLYAIVIMARDNVSSTMTEFEFMRPLILNKDQTKIKAADYFECITRTMYASSKPSDEGCIAHRDKSHLNRQDVCWAVTDLIHELCSVNMEPSRNGDNWRNGLEIIIQYHVFSKNMVGHWYNYDINDDNTVDKSILSKVNIYNFPVCGYVNSNNTFKFEFPLTIIQA